MSMPKVFHTMATLKKRIIEEGDCWIWTGPRTWNTRTPLVSHGGNMVPVRRLILTLKGQPIPAFVSTSCGCRECVNPAHFTLRTAKEHAQVMCDAANEPSPKAIRIAKVAATKRKQGKLTMEQAREIRNGDMTCDEAAAMYGVDRSLASKIRRGESWREFGAANPFAGLM
jgi:hypothetical protein